MGRVRRPPPKPRTPGELAPKRARFAEEYLKDLNATQAAIRAGYSPKTAYAQGHRLLKDAQVAAAIAAGRTKAAEDAGVTVQGVLHELKLLGFSDIGQILDFDGIEPHLRTPADISVAARKAIAGIKVRRYVEGSGEDAQTVEVTEFKLWSKIDALEKLGRYLGMFKDRLELTGKDGKPLISFEALRAILAARRAAKAGAVA